VARDTVYSILGNLGFTVTQSGDWSARAERGSKGASIALGAFAGKAGRHVILDVAFQTTPEGHLAANFSQQTSGMSGGLIGMNQANKIYKEIYDSVGTTLQNAGVLVSSSGM